MSVSTFRSSPPGLLLGANCPSRAPLASMILMHHWSRFVRTKPGYRRSKISRPTTWTCGRLHRTNRKASACPDSAALLASWTVNSRVGGAKQKLDGLGCTFPAKGLSASCKRAKGLLLGRQAYHIFCTALPINCRHGRRRCCPNFLPIRVSSVQDTLQLSRVGNPTRQPPSRSCPSATLPGHSS